MIYQREKILSLPTISIAIVGFLCLFLPHVEPQRVDRELWKDTSVFVGDQIPITWLMGFPRTGQTYILDIVQTMTQTAVATNYGTVMFDSNLKQELDRQDDSVKVYENRGHGPYLFSKGFPAPNQGTVLTRTHCGGFCAECMPAGYVMHPKHFKYECASGLKYHKNTDTVETVRYDFDLIERAVHLFRNPFDTVVSRFFQLWVWHSRKGDSYFTDSYPQNKTGFVKWCTDNDTDERRLRAEKNWYNPPDYENAMNVLCHAEFYKLVQWHNNTYETTDRFNITPMELHYEDFEFYFDDTVSELISFLGLEDAVVADPPEFIFRSGYSDNFFTFEQRKALSPFVKGMASNRTYAQLRRYLQF